MNNFEIGLMYAGIIIITCIIIVYCCIHSYIHCKSKPNSACECV